MSLKFMENFYQYAQPGTALAAANSNFNTQWITHGAGSIIISEGFEPQSRSLVISRTNSAYGQVERRFDTTEDTIIIGWAFRATARGDTTFKMSTASRTDFLELLWPREFQLGATVGPATILLNKKYFVEVKLTKSTGAVEIKVNGYPYLTGNVGAVTESLVQCYFGWTASGDSADYSMSHVYFIDSEAGKYTDFLGPHRVLTRPVTEAIDPGWQEEPEGTPRVDIMNNIPALAGEYTESDTVGEKDFYKSNSPVAGNAVINAVAVTSLLTKTDIDDQYVALAVSDGVTDKLGADISIPIQPTYFQSVFETDASDQDWEPSTTENVVFGPVVQPRP